MSQRTNKLLKEANWTIESESPLVIRHADGSLATGRAAQLVCHDLLTFERNTAIMDALRANQVFHTPIALRRRGGQWDEYEMDAIKRTRAVLQS